MDEDEEENKEMVDKIKPSDSQFIQVSDEINEIIETQDL
jgi:hypothetical protein